MLTTHSAPSSTTTVQCSDWATLILSSKVYCSLGFFVGYFVAFDILPVLLMMRLFTQLYAYLNEMVNLHETLEAAKIEYSAEINA